MINLSIVICFYNDGKHKDHNLIYIENNKSYIKQNGKWKVSKNNNIDANDYKQPMKFLNEKMFKKNIKYSQSGQDINASLDLNAKQRQQLLNMLIQDKSTDTLDKAIIKDTKVNYHGLKSMAYRQPFIYKPG